LPAPRLCRRRRSRMIFYDSKSAANSSELNRWEVRRNKIVLKRMRDIRYDTQRDVSRDPSRIKSRNESSYGEPRASSNSRELNARLPRGDVTRKSIPIALRSAGGEAGRNICRDAGSWPMAIVGRNPSATRCSCMHARARARARAPTYRRVSAAT